MAVLRLPVDGIDANYNISFDLDGVEYQLQLRYNDRDASWYFNIVDINGTLLRSGIKVVPNYTLNRQIADSRAPAGELLLVDPRAALLRGPPTQDQLGTETVLTYIEASSG